MNDKDTGFAPILYCFEREFIVHFNYIKCAGGNYWWRGPQGGEVSEVRGQSGPKGVAPEVGGHEVRLVRATSTITEVILDSVTVRQMVLEVKPVECRGQQRNVVIVKMKAETELRLTGGEGVIKSEGRKKCLEARGVCDHNEEVTQGCSQSRSSRGCPWGKKQGSAHQLCGHLHDQAGMKSG